jgi:ribosome-associated heat shock protein Hsp15
VTVGVAAPPAKVRLDVWLWRARFHKSRAMAQAAIAAGAVRLVRGEVSRVVAKSSEPVGPGDALTFPQGSRLRSVLILATGVRRGPASEARAMYQEADPQAAHSDETTLERVSPEDSGP